MYESFFRFHDRPFAAAPLVEKYYPAESTEQARQTLIRIVERAEGPGLIVGPAGVGKSLLCRLLSEYFRDRFDVVVLSSARISTRKALLQNILFELGLPYRDLEEGELRLSLLDFLQPGNSSENGMLLIVDEAHALPMRLLDEIRMITNLMREGQVRVRLVLAGGPKLEERFAHPKLESFNQRLAARCYLDALGREDTHRYVHSQIASVGGEGGQVFEDSAVEAIYQATGGIPRLINQVCDHALVLACAGGRRELAAVGIEEAWSDLQQLPGPWEEAPAPLAGEEDNVVEFGSWDEDPEPVAEQPVVEDDSIETTSCLEHVSADEPTCIELTQNDVADVVVDETKNEENLIEELVIDDSICETVSGEPELEETFHDETLTEASVDESSHDSPPDTDGFEKVSPAVVLQEEWSIAEEIGAESDGADETEVESETVAEDLPGDQIEKDTFDFIPETTTGVVCEAFASNNQASIELVEIDCVEIGVEPDLQLDVIEQQAEEDRGDQSDDTTLCDEAPADPFGEFAEEEVVVDNVTARSIESFQGRPSVLTDLGRELAATLDEHEEADEEPSEDDISSGTTSPDLAAPATADASALTNESLIEPTYGDTFEYTILDESATSAVDMIGASGDFELPEFELEPAVEPAEVREEEAAECVTLRISEEIAEDDRDLIIIEGQQEPEAPETAEEAEVSRTLEYRELFAQLRKA